MIVATHIGAIHIISIGTIIRIAPSIFTTKFLAIRVGIKGTGRIAPVVQGTFGLAIRIFTSWTGRITPAVLDAHDPAVGIRGITRLIAPSIGATHGGTIRIIAGWAFEIIAPSIGHAKVLTIYIFPITTGSITPSI